MMKRIGITLGLLVAVMLCYPPDLPAPTGGVGVGLPSRQLDELEDVTISSPTNNQALAYSATATKWVNATVGGGDMFKSTYDANSDNAIDDTAIASSISRDSELSAHAGSASVHHTATVDTDDQTLDEIGNPGGDTAFTMGNNTLTFSFSGPTGADGAFEIDGAGGFSGDLVHVHQHTGNPGATDLLHLEAADSDVTALRIVATSDPAVWVTGNIDLSGEVDGVDVSAHAGSGSIHYTQGNITTVGTLTAGTWNATAVTGLYIDESTVDHDTLSNFDANEHFTQASITTLGTVTVGDIDGIASNADSATAGYIEVATIAETNTGTSQTLAVSPDALTDWTGSTNVTTLGTIGTGEWQGTTIDEAYLDTTLSSITVSTLNGSTSIDTLTVVNAVTLSGVCSTDNNLLRWNTGGTVDCVTQAGGGDMSTSTYDVDTDGDIDLAAGGLEADMSDPNDHRIVGWDDTDGTITYMDIGTNLAYNATTDTLSASGGGGNGFPYIDYEGDGVDATADSSTDTLEIWAGDGLTGSVADNPESITIWFDGDVAQSDYVARRTIPRFKFQDTTASEDDYWMFVDANVLNITNQSDGGGTVSKTWQYQDDGDLEIVNGNIVLTTADATVDGVNLNDITALGTIASGTWNATAVTGLYIDESTVDHDTLKNFSADEHFTQANITATGTIGSGVWNGTAVDEAYLDTTWTSGTIATLNGATVIDTLNVINALDLDGVCSTTGYYLKWNTGGDVDCGDPSGGSSNSFATWDVDNGTDPVADSSADTILIYSGTGITITGDATADSITIASHAAPSSADSATQGIIEVATIAETNTGTSQTLAVSPDGLDGWTGSGQVTTVGTIGTGTWNGSTVDEAYLDTNWNTGTVNSLDFNAYAKLIDQPTPPATADGIIAYADSTNWNPTGDGEGPYVYINGSWVALFTGSSPASADSATQGIIEVATIAETNTGTSQTLAVSPDGLTDWTGSGNITTVGTLASGDADSIVSNADSVTVGKVEIATIAETNTGTSQTLAVSPDGLTDWTGSGNITTVGTVASGTWNSAITDGIINEPDLDETGGAPGDNDVLTYNTAGTNFTWVAESTWHLDSGTDNVDDTHINWGSGAGQVDADDVPDGGTNVIITSTQETNFGTAYTHANGSTGADHTYIDQDVTTTGTPTFTSATITTIDVGNADTSITRTGAGDIAVEGQGIYRAGGTDVAVADGGTGAGTAATARANLEAPAPFDSVTIAGTAITPDTYPIGKQNVAITITDIHCITDTGTVIIELYEGSATSFDGGTTVDAAITCDSNGAEDDGSLTNGTIDANDWLAARIGTEASSPTIVGITWYYTVD